MISGIQPLSNIPFLRLESRVVLCSNIEGYQKSFIKNSMLMKEVIRLRA